MERCPNCGTILKEGKYCPNCGFINKDERDEPGEREYIR